MSRVSFAALTAAFVCVLAGPASAAVVLDQASIPETGHIGFAGGSSLGFGSGGYAQSFTVGVSGLLDRVTLGVQHWTFQGAAADLHVEILDDTFGVLFAQDVAAGDLPDYTFDGFDWADSLTLDVRAAGINVLAGDTYLLKVTAPGPTLFGHTWIEGYNDGVSNIHIDYADGRLYSWEEAGVSLPAVFDDLDLGFRTYVDEGVFAAPSGAPEPAAWALMIAGFGLAGAALRRRSLRAV